MAQLMSTSEDKKKWPICPVCKKRKQMLIILDYPKQENMICWDCREEREEWKSKLP